LPGLFDKPLSTSYISKNQFTVENILDVVNRAVQSKKPEDFDNIQDNRKMKIVVQYAKIVQGGAKRKRQEESASDDEVDEAQSILNLDDYCRVKRFISVLKPDKLCLLRAIVIAKAHCYGEPNTKHLKNKCPRKLAMRVNEIVHALELPLDVDLNLTHVKRIEDYLQNYTIVVYGSSARTQAPLYYNK
jgi:hypothetical protein